MFPQPSAVATTIPSTSPIAQPVRQCSVACTAARFREVCAPSAWLWPAGSMCVSSFSGGGRSLGVRGFLGSRACDLVDFGFGVDVEAEHHPALVVFGDVAVRHPQAGVGDVEQDVDGLAGANEHGVLPGQVGFGDPVSGEDEEAAGAVDVEGVVHGMVGVHLVEQSDLDLVADLEAPVDRVVLGSRCAVNQLPAHVGGSRDPVDLDHVVFPLDASGFGVTVFSTLVGMAVSRGGSLARLREELRRQ